MELTPYEVTAGQEKLVKGDDGNVYGGQHVKELYDETPDNELLIGEFDDPIRGPNQPARIPLKNAYRHFAITGVTGYGKSTLIRSLLLQFARNGDGFTFFDPKGQDSTELLQQLPEDRLEDVVWIEPGRDDGQFEGYNLLQPSVSPDNEDYEREVQNIIELIIDMLKSDIQCWGAIMDLTVQTVLSQLIRADHPYTLVDAYKILDDDEERKAFVNKFGDDIDKQGLQHLAEYDSEDMSALMRRFQKWTGNRVLRQMLCSKNGKSYGSLIRDNKLVFVRLSNVSSNGIKELVSEVITAGLWSGVQTHNYAGEQNPHMLAIDEFDLLHSDGMPFDEMLSKGRSLRLGVITAFQQFEQLLDETEEAMANIDNLFSFAFSKHDSSQSAKVAQKFNIGANRLTELQPFEFIGRLYTHAGLQTDPLTITSFAPLPPERSEAEARSCIEEYIEENYVDVPTGFKLDEFGVHTE